jgi:hypothetical protein
MDCLVRYRKNGITQGTYYLMDATQLRIDTELCNLQRLFGAESVHLTESTGKCVDCVIEIIGR